MSNLGGQEILLILFIALVVLGPDKLPEAARKVGGFVRQVRQISNGFQQEVRKAIEIDPKTQGDVPFHPEEARIHPPGTAAPEAVTAGSSIGSEALSEPTAPDVTDDDTVPQPQAASPAPGIESEVRAVNPPAEVLDATASEPMSGQHSEPTSPSAP